MKTYQLDNETYDNNGDVVLRLFRNGNFLRQLLLQIPHSDRNPIFYNDVRFSGQDLIHLRCQNNNRLDIHWYNCHMPGIVSQLHPILYCYKPYQKAPEFFHAQLVLHFLQKSFFFFLLKHQVPLNTYI